MKFLSSLLCFALLASGISSAAEPEFPLTEDSKPQAGVAKGTMIKDTYRSEEQSVFPGTEREYQIYIPAGLDRSKPAAFMVFQDGVIYQAPVVFDNLIARKEIPPLIGIFIKPGVVPAANENALPRYNRSYEYDSITTTYSEFLINEFLPAVEQKHRIQLSTDPNMTAISGNSSGGICAFMVAWHRPDRFRRIFTGVGTYVGIHGADQLPVLVRKIEPKPLRVFLQSGTGDNNLYCGDWWMANQMMERSLTWAGYEVNHAWGEGGHNGKHATQIFPDVLRWLWKDWQTTPEVKANVKGESKWKGYEVVEPEGEWATVRSAPVIPQEKWYDKGVHPESYSHLSSDTAGTVYATSSNTPLLVKLADKPSVIELEAPPSCIIPVQDDGLLWTNENDKLVLKSDASIPAHLLLGYHFLSGSVMTHTGLVISAFEKELSTFSFKKGDVEPVTYLRTPGSPPWPPDNSTLCLSPDQTQLYLAGRGIDMIFTVQVNGNNLQHGQPFCQLDGGVEGTGLCVDTEGRLYVATSLGIQVCDQAGRVNFIIPTPKPPMDVCLGGKDLSELFIACGDTIYKRPTKVHGVVSGQQAPVKPAAPKL